MKYGNEITNFMRANSNKITCIEPNDHPTNGYLKFTLQDGSTKIFEQWNEEDQGLFACAVSNKPWDPSIRGITSLSISAPKAKKLSFHIRNDQPVIINDQPLEKWGEKVTSTQSTTTFEKKPAAKKESGDDNSYLSFGNTIMAEFSKKYKSSESYCSHLKYPNVELDKVKSLLEYDFSVIQAYLVSTATNYINRRIATLSQEAIIIDINIFSLQSVALRLTNHGECSPLAIGLIMEVAKYKFVDSICMGKINENASHDGKHTFVLMTNKSNTIQVVLDPLFKIVCSLKDYQNHPLVINWMRHMANDKSWSFKTGTMSFMEYSLSPENISLIENQITTLLKFSDDLVIKELMSVISYATSLQKNYKPNEAIKYLRIITRECLRERKTDESAINNFLNYTLPETCESPINTSNKSTLFPKPLQNSSESPHDQLLNKIKAMQAKIPRFKDLFPLANKNEYNKILRMASNDPDGADIVEFLLSLKESFNLNINEQVGKDKMSALHYAAKKNKAAYDLLISHGADPSLTNADGISASELLSKSNEFKK